MVNAFRCTRGKALLQAAQHLAVPFQRQFRMQPAHDVEFGDGFAPPLARAMPDFFERHGVRLGIAHALAEGAQPATGHAHVGGVDMAVDVEIGGVAVQPFAHQVRQVAQAQNVVGAVKRDAVIERQPFAGFHFAANGNQARIVNFDWHASGARSAKQNIGSPE